MKKGVCIAVICIVLLGALAWTMPKKAVVRDFAMDTVISVELKAKSPKKTANKAIAEIKRLDCLMSISNPNSDIYKINSAPCATAVKVDKEVFALLEKCMEISQKTDGAFDITVNPLCEIWDIKAKKPKVPKDDQIKTAKESVGYKNLVLDKKNQTVTKKKDSVSITLGAIAKGYATDKAKEILKDCGVKDAIIDFGGNIYIMEKAKTVGLQTPFKPRGEYFKTISISDKSVVTSGLYERYFEEDGKIYHHVIDPKTGYPADTDAMSVSIISGESYLADALSTAVFVSGEKRASVYLKQFEDVHAIIYKKDNSLLELKNN